MISTIKKKSGRKSLSLRGNKAKQIHISFGEELETRIKQYCSAYGFPMAAFIRAAVEKELKHRINNTTTI